MQVAGKIKELFHNEGIHSTTIQPEFVEVNKILGFSSWLGHWNGDCEVYSFNF